MKKIEIKFNKNNAKKYAVYLIKHRRIFFVVFFSALFIFTFNVIYKNVYYNIEQIDYAKSRSFEDDETRREIMFEKVVENIEFREQMIRDVKNKKYKNLFSFNDEESFDENGNGGEENNDEDDDSVIPPAENGNGGEENNDKSDDLTIPPIEPPVL